MTDNPPPPPPQNRPNQPQFVQQPGPPPVSADPGYTDPEYMEPAPRRGPSGPPPGWVTVRAGMVVQQFSCSAMIAGIILMAVIAGQARSSGRPNVSPEGAQLIVIGLGIAWLAYIVSFGLCLAVPSESRLRGRAIGAFVIMLAGNLAFIGITITTASRAIALGPVMTAANAQRLGAEMGAMMIVAMFLVMIGWGAMMSFLHAMGDYLSNDKLKGRARSTSTCALIGVVISFFPGIGIFGALLMLVAVVVYMMTLSAARDAITAGPRRRPVAAPMPYQR